MASQLTVTGVAGPGQVLTAAVFTNISDIKFDMLNRVVSFRQDSVDKEVSVSAATVVTCTVSAAGDNFAWVIS